MNSLYIFVTSDRPDQYLNSIAYCLEKRGVRRIIFVQIDNQMGVHARAEEVCRDVYDLTYQLSQGKYRYHVGGLSGQEVFLSQQYSDPKQLNRIQEKYRSYLVGSVTWDTKTIDYTNLKNYIRSLSQSKEQPTVDVSCVSKSYMADILSCCLLNNVKNLFVFDLLVEPNFTQPWKTLIHDLKEDKEFRYVNLVRTSIFQENLKAVLIRTTPLVTSIAATLICVILALIANFTLGNNNAIIQGLSVVSAVLGVIAFVLIFLPLRST